MREQEPAPWIGSITPEALNRPKTTPSWCPFWVKSLYLMTKEKFLPHLNTHPTISTFLVCGPQKFLIHRTYPIFNKPTNTNYTVQYFVFTYQVIVLKSLFIFLLYFSDILRKAQTWNHPNIFPKMIIVMMYVSTLLLLLLRWLVGDAPIINIKVWVIMGILLLALHNILRILRKKKSTTTIRFRNEGVGYFI